jgi:adenine specific DNA methylase Mod
MRADQQVMKLILASIDDYEIEKLRVLMNEIFGQGIPICSIIFGQTAKE